MRRSPRKQRACVKCLRRRPGVAGRAGWARQCAAHRGRTSDLVAVPCPPPGSRCDGLAAPLWAMAYGLRVRAVMMVARSAPMARPRSGIPVVVPVVWTM